MLDAVSQDQDYAARVAASVAARYGVTGRLDVVQCVPPGVSGLPQPFWDGKSLVYGEPQKGWRRKPGAASPNRQGLVDPAVQARRERVVEMHATGASDYQMADAFGVDVRVIRIDRKVMRLRANVVRHKRPSTQAEIRIGRVREMAQAGKTTAEMMDVLGVSRDTLRDLARHAGVVLARLARRDAHVMQDRIARVAQMVAAGASRAEIVSTLGISVKQARDCAARAGVELPEWQRPAPRGKAPRKSRAGQGSRIASGQVPRAPKVKMAAANTAPSTRQIRLAAMREMDMAHVTVAQLMAMFGVSEPQIRRDLAEVGKTASSRSSADDRIDATRASIAQMAALGKTRKEIMGALGIDSWSTMKRHLDALGIDLPRADAGRCKHGPVSAQEAEALRARIAQMRSEGMTISQIADAVGRSGSTVSHHIRVLGMVGNSRSAGQRAG